MRRGPIDLGYSINKTIMSKKLEDRMRLQNIKYNMRLFWDIVNKSTKSIKADKLKDAIYLNTFYFNLKYTGADSFTNIVA